MLATPEYQAMYAQSDGVCLSHLRLALHLADSDAGRLHLVASTEERLATLEDDLREYTRKQVWQNRHETVTVEEQTAAQRSVDFFAGSAFGERCNHRPIARPFVQQGDGSPELVPDDLAVWESSPLQAGKDDTPGRDNRRPGR